MQHRRIKYPHLASVLALDPRPKYLIAALAGIAPNRFGMILSGRVEPTTNECERIAKIVGGDVEHLFG